MANSLLFIPDISGFTEFIQTTEVEHSQHVIAELLEVLIQSNTEELQLAEVEGDALFFYKEGEVPSQERLLAQIESMFIAFYSHLKLLKENRICPCNACATAPNLQLKIIAHCGEIQFIEVQRNRKPFGKEVIEAHRMLKNSVDSDNYVLISKSLASEIGLPIYYYSKLFKFREGVNIYDSKELTYIYAVINSELLQLKPLRSIEKVILPNPPNLTYSKNIELSAEKLYEYISNFKYRYLWVNGVDKFEYNENEINRKGTEHICVIKEKHLDFTTVVKEVKKGQLIYGEFTKSPPIVDTFYQFYTITPLSKEKSNLKIETYWFVTSPIKKIIIFLIAKRKINKTVIQTMENIIKLASIT
ncbi:uncharacterized protein DUF2652 [Maribacter vaceletii]|uniref:Uncharacterized protein DUF2652 n=1 Tax=Maribacter vaceletii TaxID=1206816 RepID=A0A495ECH6_9FLAO|nr:DUF2652 domain-containing protein [Maribacter vaceletii]RKR14588.1 uncharacterized protein DUF2652 [Maribacter vaceletii]